MCWPLNSYLLKLLMSMNSCVSACPQMFSFAIQALDSFRERLSEWPEFIYHILKVRHIHEAQNDILDYIMNIVKENQAVDPSTAVNDSNVCSVVARPIIVKAPTSLLQDTQVGVRNLKSAVDFVYPAGNRFSGSQSRYLSGQVGDESCMGKLETKAVSFMIVENF